LIYEFSQSTGADWQMTVMIAEVYDALRSAGADDEKARRAAEAVADARVESMQSRAELRSDMQSLDSGLKREMQSLGAALRSEMQGIRSELSVLKWMVGGLLAIAVATFIRTLFG
jgi:hypothetical protein